jgi:hypothetical protein
MSDSGIETMLASEAVLAKDWDTPEEDEAWEVLSDKRRNMEHLDIYINAGVLLIGIVGVYLVARNTGKSVDIMALAVKLVTDAEVLIKPIPGETKEAHNKRKLDYVIEQMQPALPKLDLNLIRNLIERAVDIVKHYPTQSLTSGVTAEGQAIANKLARKDLG